MRPWLLAGLVFLLVMLAAGTPRAATVTVPGDYATIQAAINASVSGGTVLVSPGTYNENISISIPLTLSSTAGSGSTNIVGSSASVSTITVAVNGVAIAGFNVSGGKYGFDLGASVSDITVSDCNVGGTGNYQVYAPPAAIPDVLTGLQLLAKASGNAVFVRTGTIAETMTWPVLPADFSYYLENVQVDVGGAMAPVLHLLSGTVVKLRDDARIYIGNVSSGGLIADGVVFTSYRDDTIGGDTTGDGATLPAWGQWRMVYLAANAIPGSCTFTNCEFRYGGQDGLDMVDARVAATFTGCTFSQSLNAGLGVVDAAPVVTGCSLIGNKYGLELTGASSAAGISGNTLDHTGSDGYLINVVADCVEDVVGQNTLVGRADSKYGRLALQASSLSQSAAWPAPPAGLSYYLQDVLVNVSGPSSPVLHLSAGAVVKFANNGEFYVGHQAAGGMIADDVVFTSYTDDTVGGDSNGDGAATTPAGNQWRRVYVGTSAIAGSCTFTNCEFRYGGQDGLNMADVRVAATFTGCTFTQSASAGLAAVDAAPSVTGCSFVGNKYGLELTGASSAAGITGNTIDHAGSDGYLINVVADCVEDVVGQNTLVGRADSKYGRLALQQSTLTASATWPTPPAGLSYYLQDVLVNISGPGSPVLHLLPGTVVKFANNGEFYAGHQSAGGVIADGVVFTSYTDDTVGGDSNGDGTATTPAGNQWRRVYVGTSAIAGSCTFTNCEFRYGGQDGLDMVDVRVAATFTGCTFRQSASAGLAAVDAAPVVTGCTLVGNQYGLELSGASSAAGISGNTIDHTGSNGYLINVVADCVEDVVGQNTLVGRADSKYGRLALQQSTLTATATWPTPPAGLSYYLQDVLVDVSGPGSPVLHLLPGTVVKFANNGEFFTGYLSAGGMIANGVVFTSYTDDTVGGDSNGDGTATTPAWNQWRRLYVGTNAIAGSCVFTNCEFRYGGQDGLDMVDTRVAATFSGCTFRQSANAGLAAIDAAPIVTGCLLIGNKYGIELTGASSAAGISGNTIDHTGSDGYLINVVADCVEDVVGQNTLVGRPDAKYGRLALQQSTLTATSTWPVPPSGMSYWIQDVSVSVGAVGNPVLHLLPGTAVKLLNDAQILVGNGVGGGLIADGTVFTSYTDDTVGGDANGDGTGTTPAWNQWRRIYFGPNSVAGSCVLTNCEFRYGGQDALDMVDTRVAATFTGCTFRQSVTSGLSAVDAAPLVTGSLFIGNRYGLSMSGASSAAGISGNTIDHSGSDGYLINVVADCVEDVVGQNTLVGRADSKYGRLNVRSSTLSGSATWPVPPANLSYTIEDVVVSVGGATTPVLRLLPGTVVKMKNNAQLQVGASALGGMIADGVVFTSYADDSEGGDANGDGTGSTPGWSQWQRIYVGTMADPDSCIFDGCEFRFGGQDGFNMVETRAGGTFMRCIFYNSYTAGLAVYGNAGLPTIVGYSQFSLNRNGIRQQSNGRILWRGEQLCFDNNSEYGILVDAFTDGHGPQSMTSCWWGDASGPGGAGPGSGDQVSANVTYAPWATTSLCSPIPPTGVAATPRAFELMAPVPNPFNPSTTIAYEVPVTTHVSLQVFSVRGALVRTLVSGTRTAGGYSETWNGVDDAGNPVPSGVYFCVMRTNEFRETRKLVLLK